MKKFVHYKNNKIYTVTGSRKFQSTIKELDGKTVYDYKDEDGNKFSREKKEFHGIILIDGKHPVPRFRLLLDNEVLSMNTSDINLNNNKPKGQML